MTRSGSLPSVCAFRHHGTRDGFEVVYVERQAGGFRIDSHSTAVDGGESWAVHATIVVDDQLRTRHATVTGQSRSGSRQVALETDGGQLAHRWRAGAVPRRLSRRRSRVVGLHECAALVHVIGGEAAAKHSGEAAHVTLASSALASATRRNQTGSTTRRWLWMYPLRVARTYILLHRYVGLDLILGRSVSTVHHWRGVDGEADDSRQRAAHCHSV